MLPRHFLLHLLPLFSALLLSAAPPPSSPQNPAPTQNPPPLNLTPVRQWIAHQKELRSVSAEFTQTRSLRSLRSPIATPGKLWFQAPDAFRWEIGSPAKTILVRKGAQMHLINPSRKRVERFAINANSDNQGLQGVALMKFPIARDFNDFQRQFEILSVDVSGPRCDLALLPRDAQARKMLSALKLAFDTGSGVMLSLEMVTRDGSSLRSDFTKVQANPSLDRTLFDVDLEGYELIDSQLNHP
jgi:outer membrane lipoprotein carrier protein